VAVLETVTRVRVSSGAYVERLAPHPRFPLVAGLDSDRPAVHIWDYSEGELREAGTIGGGSAVYGEAIGWDRMKRTPAVAWHPDEPLLLVASEGAAMQWTTAGASRLDGLPPAAAYRRLAFSPDGQALWASPSALPREDPWQYRSDAIDPASGTARTCPGWDTGIATHPGGGLVATLQSDQGATLVLFARVDQQSTPTQMRVLRNALILDVDGYGTPVFSADGRHFAIRGNAYGNTLAVYEFPSLNRVLATTLGEPSPGYPYPQEWLDQMRAWSRHNIAFGTQPGVLWVGTPSGSLIELDVPAEHAAAHDVLADARVTALCATAAGDLLAATAEGDLALIAVTADSATAHAANAPAPQALAAAFLEGTSDVPPDGNLEAHLVLTDGQRTWGQEDLETVTTATSADPTWLQLQAAMNAYKQES
jgi:hypothetical protein